MVSMLPHNGSPITAEQFDPLPIPDDRPHRLEIEDGRLLVMDRPGRRHIIAAHRLADCLDDQLPNELEAMIEFEAELAGPSPRRVPDVAVCVEESTEQQRMRANQILLAVEIVSPGESAVRDYIKKPTEYAANGIPTTWVVDITENPTSLTVYALDDTASTTSRR